MFYTCAEEGFAVVPVALEYRDPNIAWVGNTWFIPHAFRHFEPDTSMWLCAVRRTDDRIGWRNTAHPSPRLDRQALPGSAIALTPMARTTENHEQKKGTSMKVPSMTIPF